MSVIEAIKNRTSNPRMTDEDVDVDLVRRILDAAVCVPVHYNTSPWRFLVVRGEGRRKLGDFMARRLLVDMVDPDSPKNVAYLEKIRKKPLRAPVIIVAGAARTADCPKALMVENVASVAAACQNILLAASELDLSAIWRTGSLTYGEDTVDFLGFEAGTQLVGFLYLGHPAKAPPAKPRETADKFTRWLE